MVESFKLTVGGNVDVRFMMWVRFNMTAGRIVGVIKE
jgi:hypothetical protein